MMHPNIPSTIALDNITVEPTGPHAEVMDLESGDVWLCQQPITEARFNMLKTARPLVKSGYGRAHFDYAWFLRSPGADADGPLDARDIDGLRFVRVARPREMVALRSDHLPTRLVIEKHHVIGFHADRKVTLARLPDGAFYVLHTETLTDIADVDPEDWEMFTLTLFAPWTIALPCPAHVYFFGNLRSFAGPLSGDELPGEPVAV